MLALRVTRHDKDFNLMQPGPVGMVLRMNQLHNFKRNEYNFLLFCSP